MRTLALLLLCSPALAADQLDDAVFIEINVVRLANDVPAVASDPILEQSAAITAEWLGYANRGNREFFFHNVNTAWALKNYPQLHWERLRATFPDGLPEQLSGHDVARLCGWEGGLVLDIEGEARRNDAVDLVDGWADSPFGHQLVLFNVIADFDVCGVASEPRGGGKQIVVAVFGDAL